MTWGCRQPNRDFSFLLAHSFDWNAKKVTKIVTPTLTGEEGRGRRVSTRWTWLTGLPFGIIRQAPSTLSNPWLGWSLLVLSSNKTIRQSKQIVSTKPHILNSTELNEMYFHQFLRAFPVCFDGISAAWVSHGCYFILSEKLGAALIVWREERG